MKNFKKALVEIASNYMYMCLLTFSIALLLVFPIGGIATLIASILIYNLCGSVSDKVIQVKYFRWDVPQLKKISVGDWIDLRAAERVELKAGEYKLIPLGVGMILPDGYEAHVLPRSSTPSKFGVLMANSMGIIDNSYSGDNDEWKFPAVALRDTVIEKGDRICQFRIEKNQPPIKFETVFNLNEVSRGGIGSTGKN